MNMSRNVAKWQPFNAVISGDIMIKDVLNRKYIVKKPVLSDDQIKLLEVKIFNSFANQEYITIKFYRNGKLFLKNGIVTSIDTINQKVFIDNCYSVFFTQIIEIY